MRYDEGVYVALSHNHSCAAYTSTTETRSPYFVYIPGLMFRSELIIYIISLL